MAKTAEKTKGPSHPLLSEPNGHTWYRLGKDGRASYYIHYSIKGEEDEKPFSLWSEFSWMLFGTRYMNKYKTLDEAVKYGEQFLKGIDKSNLLRHTRLSVEVIENLLATRLPIDVNESRSA
jgi:hypothetical protein